MKDTATKNMNDIAESAVSRRLAPYITTLRHLPEEGIKMLNPQLSHAP